MAESGGIRTAQELLLSPSNTRPSTKKTRKPQQQHSIPKNSPSELHRPFSSTPRGYDWAASRVDREDRRTSASRCPVGGASGSLSPRGQQADSIPLAGDEEYYRRLNDFRHANHQACFAPRKSSLSASSLSSTQETSVNRPRDGRKTSVVTTPHMSGNYRLDDRLLPTALHHGEPKSCTLCNKANNQSSTANPKAYVCVSFPRSSLKSVYKWSSRNSPQQRCQDDGRAGFGLSSSCKEGWQSGRIACIPPCGSMNLKEDCSGQHLQSRSFASSISSLIQEQEKTPRSVRHSTPQLLHRSRLQGMHSHCSRSSASTQQLARQLTF